MQPIQKATLEAADTILQQMQDDLKNDLVDDDWTEEQYRGSYSMKAEMHLKDLLQTHQACYQQLTDPCKTLVPEKHAKTLLTKHIQEEHPTKKEMLFSVLHGDLKRPRDEKLSSASKSLRLSCNTKLNLSLALPDKTTMYTETPTSGTWEDLTQPESDTKQLNDCDIKPLNSEPSVDIMNKHHSESSYPIPTLADFGMPDEDWWNSLETIKELPMVTQQDDPNNERSPDQHSLFETGLLATGPRPVLKWRRGLAWQYWNDYDTLEFEQEEPTPMDEDQENGMKGPMTEAPMNEDQENGPNNMGGPSEEKANTRKYTKPILCDCQDLTIEHDNNNDSAYWKQWLEDPNNVLIIGADVDENTRKQMEDTFWNRDPQHTDDDPNLILRESY